MSEALMLCCNSVNLESFRACMLCLLSVKLNASFGSLSDHELTKQTHRGLLSHLSSEFANILAQRLKLRVFLPDDVDEFFPVKN
jgi:hypothetical protein